MTINECYAKMGADYESVLSRFMSEKMVVKFALKFLDDTSFDNLEAAIKKGDAEEAFRAVHTLKGVCLNLGFDNLYAPSAELTEVLRGRKLEGYETLLAEVEKQYDITVSAIKELKASM